MSTNKQRRESERQRLQRQLEERRQREVARRRFTTIASIVGALVLVAAIIVIVAVASSGGGKKKSAASPTPSPTNPAAASPTPTPTAPPAPLPTAPCVAPSAGPTATFAGLTITGAKDLKAAPKVTGKANAADPATLVCQDLVVGTGTAAATTSTATVEYIGLIYKTGAVFQSSWDSNPATFPLVAGPTGVITGFSQGIAGAGKVAPMKVGGRRVLIMPAAIAYGANPPSGIPPNASLVFVVDLQKIAA